MPVQIRAYTSPTVVLLAFNWEVGKDRADFLGFAIERSPGFEQQARSWLPNRIGFNGPPPEGQPDFPSNAAPIQKFYWWDAHIVTKDRGSPFTYNITPMVGDPAAPTPLTAEAASIVANVPNVEEHGITTHFNRAVMSSQAFSLQFPDLSTPSLQKAARAWLANGMEQAVPQFLDRAAGKDIEGAIYHLTDGTWIIPALQNYGGAVSLTYNHTGSDDTSDAAIIALEGSGRPANAFVERTHANIMHNKFLVRVGAADNAEAVLAGSANFTSEGLSVQANLLHAFESPELAALYLQRKRLLDGDPSLAGTRQAQAGWSDPITVGDATIRVYFPPEDKNTRVSLDRIVDAAKAAQHSVLLCAFDPTDGPLLSAVFGNAEQDKMMLALVNRVPAEEPTGDATRSDVAAKIEIWSQAQKGGVTGFGAFDKANTPDDFRPEKVLWPKEDPKIMVRVHHKFVIIDAEGAHPTVYTGSANFSGNSLHNNDENLLEITHCPRIAGIYLAEFLRLYEHYRARAAFKKRAAGDKSAFTLSKNNSWTKKYFDPASAESRARIAMSSGP